MKVLDLRCQSGHRFEAWFGSEADFQSQMAQAMVACPMCGDVHVTKLLSAPRLNLTTKRKDPDASQIKPLARDGVASEAQKPGNALIASQTEALVSAATGSGAGDASLQQLHAAWLALSRELMARSEDVGTAFAEQARQMHYGEIEERSIRGKTSLDEARALHEEGIAVLPLAIPDGANTTLH